MARSDWTQTPATVPSGSRVIVSVSQGPNPRAPFAYATVPDVLGLPQGTALDRLQRAELGTRVFNDYSPNTPRGRVIGQMPEPRESVPAGTETVLLVSSGRPQVDQHEVLLPDVVGMPEAEAVNRLQAAGLSPQVTREFSPSVPAGVVMEQMPSRVWLAKQVRTGVPWWAWAAIAAAALLALLLALFFLFSRDTTTVPDVTGMTQVQAAETIEAAGLAVGDITQAEAEGIEEGLVASQTPVPGEEVREGTDVDLVVAGGDALVRVPDVVGRSQQEATSELERTGLQVSVRTVQSNSVEAGEVIEQAPRAGQEVPEGTTIGIVVSEGEQAENISVPDVVGVTAADAEGELRGLGLRVLIVENPSETVAEGTVIAQGPNSGETIPPGSTVAIIVSSGVPEDGTTIDVPDVTGDDLTDAQGELSREGLRSQTVALEGTGEDANTVVYQVPAAGSGVASGSTVVLVYAR